MTGADVRIVYEHEAGEAEVEVRPGGPDATVADLAAALGAATSGLAVGDHPVAGDVRLEEAGLAPGVRVSTLGPAYRTATLARCAAERRGAIPRVVVRRVGGLRAGDAVQLGVGPALVGSDPAAEVPLDDPAVAPNHCRLDVSASGSVAVEDLGSPAGTAVNGAHIVGRSLLGPDDVARVGGCVLRVLPIERLGGADPSAAAGARPQAPIALHVVANPPARRLMGLVRRRRDVRQSGEQWAIARSRLALRHAAEARLLRGSRPDPAEALYRARTPGHRLWELRPGAEDFLVLTVGTADLPWRVPLVGTGGDYPPELTEALGALRALPAVPVPLPLRDGAVLGLSGDRPARLAVARSLLAQAVTGTGPADLAVAVCVDEPRVDDWDWTKWLPHVSEPRAGGLLLAAGTHDAAILARDLLALHRAVPGAAPARRLLLVLDGPGALGATPVELLSRAVATIMLADRPPASCTRTLAVAADGTATLRGCAPVEGLLATGMSAGPARELARALAGVENREVPEAVPAGARPAPPVTVLPFRFGRYPSPGDQPAPPPSPSSARPTPPGAGAAGPTRPPAGASTTVLPAAHRSPTQERV